MSIFQIYSPDLKDELGRLSVHGWVGVMHEVRRSFEDYGLTCEYSVDTETFPTHPQKKKEGKKKVLA